MSEEQDSNNLARVRAGGQGWWVSIAGPGVIVALIVATIGTCVIAWKALDLGGRAIEVAQPRPTSTP